MDQIFKSHLDQDYYKYSMGSFFWSLYKGISTEYAYKCRDSQIDLSPIWGDLNEQIEGMSKIRLQSDERDWLLGTKIKPSYIKNFLNNFSFDPRQVILERIPENPGISIRIKGPVEEASLWEMPLMTTISELYNNYKYGQKMVEMEELAEKDLVKALDALLLKLGETDIRLSEFGTRRRFSKKFQDKAISILKAFPKLLTGTSNMSFAKKYGLACSGTQAHECFMFYQSIVHPEDSQKRFLQDWIKFHPDLGIALTDTLGSKKWDKDFDKYLMDQYFAQRHDSGDPYVWARNRIDAYKREDISPKDKLLLFSDNLNFDKVYDLHKKFSDEIGVAFGVGTFITNRIPSMPEHKALNQVIKIVRANGRPVAKLSDDPMKAQCEDSIFLEYIKHISE